MTKTDNPGESATITSLRLLYALTGAIVLAGAYFRFKGLAFSPFAIDEYYIATSVKNILQYGVPQFEGGGYYTRGLLLQYLVAPLFALGMDHEFAFRLVTVLFNLAALPAVFLLGRHVAGVMAGCIALMFYSLSVWEIEFARFARMYAPFGALFLWYLVFLYRRIALEDLRAVKWMQFLTLAAIFLSEFAVFLALLNFLPLILHRVRRPVVETLIPFILALATYYWESVPFRRLGAPEHLPPDLVLDAAGDPALPIHLPPVLLPEMAGSFLWLSGFMLPLLLFATATVAWVRWAFRTSGPLRHRLQAILPIGILLLALVNLLGLGLSSIVILMLLLPLGLRKMLAFTRRPLLLLTAASFVASIIFWCIYAANTDWWRAMLPISTGAHVRDTVLLLFNYPNVFRDVLVPWRSAMPIQSMLMALLVLAGVWYSRDKSGNAQRSYLLLVAITLCLFVLVPVFAKPYFTTRYTFFLYPVLLVLSAASLACWSKKLLRRRGVAVTTGVSVAFVVMLIAEDFDARHLAEIDTERVTYRMGYSRGKVDQYYPRWDFRTPAEYVNRNSEPQDLVISAEYAVPYYLERMNYLYMDQDGGRFEIVASHHGTRDIWEGAPVLRTETQLFELIRTAPSDVWLIAKSDKYGFQTAGESEASRVLDAYRVFRSVDGHLDVYRIPRDRQEAQPQS